MAKTKEQKKQIVASLEQALKQAKAVVLSEIKGLNVSDTSKLRSILKKEKVSHTVVKLSLLKLALKRAGITAGELDFRTQVAVSFSPDETTAPRLLKDFGKEHPQLQMLGGILEGRLVDRSLLLALASLPTRGELLAQLANVLAGPLRGLASVLAGNLKRLLTALAQVKR